MQQNVCRSLNESLRTPCQMLLSAGMELYLNLTYAKYIFLTPA